MKKSIKPVSLAAGIALAGSLAGVQAAHADANPFSMTALSSGYMSQASIADHGKKEEHKEEKKEAEGKCGEGKCGEGKCGGDKSKEKDKDKNKKKGGEGKCGTA